MGLNQGVRLQEQVICTEVKVALNLDIESQGEARWKVSED